MFLHKKHREIWMWLSENPTRNKSDWPGWKKNGGTEGEQECECFACDYCDGKCRNCPLEWPKNDMGETVCDGNGGLYTKWYFSKDPQERSALAQLIAELPVKPEVETDENFYVGDKVLWYDKSFSYEISEGKLIDSRSANGICGTDTGIYEVTNIGLQLPTRPNAFGSEAPTNDTIIKRISDGRIFFTQQKFLKKYQPKPKFKRGDFVEFNGEYRRVSIVTARNNKYIYGLTSVANTFNQKDYFIDVDESKLCSV